jgi:hypothetical protein
MHLFHKIPEGQVILLASGVYKQVDVYTRGEKVYAAHAGGFIRLCAKHGDFGGTSKPKVSWLDIEAAGISIGPRGELQIR